MGWKPEYEENRKKREAQNPELKEKRILSAKLSQQRNRDFRIPYMREYYKKNPDKWAPTEEKKTRKNNGRRSRYHTDEEYRKKHIASVKAWAEANPEKRLDQRMRKYGITGQDYHDILEKQGGGCAICGNKDPGDRRLKRFHVDHCHETGKVRGLLCITCNMGIGKFKDNPDYLILAAEYLTKHRES